VAANLAKLPDPPAVSAPTVAASPPAPLVYVVWDEGHSIMMGTAPSLLAASVVTTLAVAQASAEEHDKEPIAIVELGGAGEWGLSGGSSYGPSVAVEFEPIRNWLEIEIGTAPLFSNGHAELDTDVLFKKPFTLSDKLEFMVGAGPQWSQTMNGGKIGAELALDFMFWPTRDRKYGWFIEPSYTYSFGREHEQSLGVSLGLLIPIQPN
jgi:hypothetical protein